MLQNLKISSLDISVCILMIIVGILIIPFNSAEAKVDENMCKQMYDRYKELGEQKFREKYKSKSFVNDCIKLYKNPTWNFAGKSKIDKHYANLEALIKNTNVEKKVDVKIMSAIPIGTGKFLIKFRACTDSSTIQKPSFLIKSQIEQYLGMTNKPLQKGKCSDYNTQVKAKQKTNINIEYVLDSSKYANIKSKPL